SASEAAVLPAILRAFDGANPLAANYLRGAVEAIADRTLQAGGALPKAEMKAFIEDRKGDPRARTLAFEWLKRTDKPLAASLAPGMISDPSADLRREAVDRLLVLGKQAAEPDEAVKHYEAALAGAVEDDQVKDLVERLKKLGKTIDLQKHFGFLTQW